MLVRIWETDFDHRQIDKLQDYANSVSLPVLRSRPGCLGVLFCKDGDRWITQTFWRDRDAIDALDQDPDYAQIVDGILALNVLGDNQKTTVYDVLGGTLQL